MDSICIDKTNVENNLFNLLLNELIHKQRININNNMRLSFNDLKRITKYLTSSIFHENNCCLWNGYVTTLKNNKHNYINFFFNKKKYSLQRLLYINYIGDLYHNEYIKYKCPFKGNCCNINHFYKVNEQVNKINYESKLLIENTKVDNINIELDNIIVNFN